MMMVRCILVETTVPVRIRPRIETMPVKGHFLSAEITSQPLLQPSLPAPRKFLLVGETSWSSREIDRLGARVLRHVPMYAPEIAVFGVLKPRPTSLYHLRPPLPGLALLIGRLLLTKTDELQRSASAGRQLPAASDAAAPGRYTRCR